MVAKRSGQHSRRRSSAVDKCVSCEREIYDGERHECPGESAASNQEIDEDLFVDGESPGEKDHEDPLCNDEKLFERLRDGYIMTGDDYEPGDERWYQE